MAFLFARAAESVPRKNMAINDYFHRGLHIALTALLSQIVIFIGAWTKISFSFTIPVSVY